ncbi:hypothetical protein [Streptomyces longisporoflavus]|uniref:Uncharacterized protein n=1 Tax=Streptomyces longisporoflavus TaxID=28044 RepID=A0ABW7QP41_9ACTN
MTHFRTTPLARLLDEAERARWHEAPRLRVRPAGRRIPGSRPGAVHALCGPDVRSFYAADA